MLRGMHGTRGVCPKSFHVYRALEAFGVNCKGMWLKREEEKEKMKDMCFAV